MTKKGLRLTVGLLMFLCTARWEETRVLAGQAGDSGVAARRSESAPLPRYREGGTPYDPGQRLTPYALERAASEYAPAGYLASPPEYSPTHAVLFKYSTGSWPSVVTACVAALTGDARYDELAYVVVTSASQQTSATSAFVAAGADMSKVQFFIAPSESVWIRDYGPHFVWEDGALAIVDSHYYPSRPSDNFVPTILGDDYLSLPTYDMPLYYSGGNFQPGPQRSAFITSLIYLDNPASAGFDETFIRALFERFQGIDTVHIMPQLPFSVDGTGHIDMWLYLVDEDTCILSEFIPGSNATAIQITNNAVPYMQALGFEVYRPKAWNSGSTHYTYTNAFRVNNRIFVPVYGTAIVPGGNSSYNDEDADAMAKWQAAAGPGVEIVPIQCNSIIPAAGAIHCIVMQVPRYMAEGPAVHVSSPCGGEVWLRGSTRAICWNASDTYNAAVPEVDLYYTEDDGATWQSIATVPNTGSYAWTVPEAAVGSVQYADIGTIRIKVVARAADQDEAEALSGPVTVAEGTQAVFDMTAGGLAHYGWGSQTLSWSNVDGNRTPAGTPLPSSAYPKMAVSDAVGGDTDPNRYISPTVSTNYESTHTFEFSMPLGLADLAEIEVLWEGYADQCTQAELYVWDYVAGQWGDGAGQTGQNRFLDNWAGNRDGNLTGVIRSDFARYISNGKMTFLVYAERPNDETFHDYLSVSVRRINPPRPIEPEPEQTGELDL